MDRDKGKAAVYNQQPSGLSSPPRTPPAQTASSFQTTPTRANQKQRRPSEREAFPDDTTGTDTANSSTESGDERDPHDLSLSPKHAARTSIVDNMLLSLDQFSAGTSVLDDYRLFHSALDPDSNDRISQDSESPGRYRGNTFSSSLSSENDAAYEEGGVSHYGIQTASGRRSNSSSNYPSSPRGAGSSIRGYEGIRSRAQPNIIGSSPPPRWEREESKGSISSTIDFGPSNNPRTRAESGSDAHSASLDNDEKTTPFPPFHDETLHYGDDDLDAAPTPSVPAGPRRYQSPTQADYTNSLNPQSSMTTVTSRKNSTKSSSRPNPTKKKSRPEDIGTIRSPESSEMDLEPPPVLGGSTLEPPAPSPTISYNKPTFPAFPPPPDPNPPRERPGFFRRVFGSTKTAPSHPPVADNVSYTTPTPEPQPQPQPEPPKLRKQSIKNDAPAPSPSVRQVVNKKSSFFAGGRSPSPRASHPRSLFRRKA